MKTKFILFCFIAFTNSAAFAIEDNEIRTVRNENIGNVSLSVPRGWTAIERHHFVFGTTFYRLVSPEKDFDLEIMFNDLAHMKMNALVDKDLELYIESNMANAAPRSVEGTVKANRFGANNDGVYARLTDKTSGPGEHILFTQGVRLLPTKKAVILFTLFSDDKDSAILNKVLNIVESISVEN